MNVKIRCLAFSVICMVTLAEANCNMDPLGSCFNAKNVAAAIEAVKNNDVDNLKKSIDGAPFTEPLTELLFNSCVLVNKNKEMFDFMLRKSVNFPIDGIMIKNLFSHIASTQNKEFLNIIIRYYRPTQGTLNWIRNELSRASANTLGLETRVSELDSVRAFVEEKIAPLVAARHGHSGALERSGAAEQPPVYDRPLYRNTHSEQSYDNSHDKYLANQEEEKRREADDLQREADQREWELQQSYQYNYR